MAEKKNRKPSTVFEYVIVFADENESKIVDSGQVLASDAQKAGLLIARKIPTSYDDKLDNLEVIIRPFA